MSDPAHEKYSKYEVFEGFLYELNSVDVFYIEDGSFWFVSPEYVRCFPAE